MLIVRVFDDIIVGDMLTFYTDGSASPNPGPGGYAVIDGNGQPLVLGREKQTTNIRMEAMALIEALRLAKGRPCQIFTDSEFWLNVLTKWAKDWEANDWRKKKGEIKNLDLVQEAYGLYNDSQATLIWVRGHANNKLNELVDDWANRARKGAKIDEKDCR